MVLDAAGCQAENFVRDGAGFDGDAAVTAELRQEWVTGKGEGVADALGGEKDGVVEVGGGGAVEGLASVKDLLLRS